MTADTNPTAQQPNAWWIVLLVGIGVLTGVGLLLGEGFPGEITATAPTTVVGIATLGYLAAAVIGIRWMAWAWAGIGTVLVFAAEAVDLSRWIVIALVGLVLVVIGLARRPRVTLPQAVAMLVYFGIGVATLLLAPRLGLAVAGGALIAHAGWDFVHYRRDIVVNRSLALWCLGLDVFVGGACVMLAVLG